MDLPLVCNRQLSQELNERLLKVDRLKQKFGVVAGRLAGLDQEEHSQAHYIIQVTTAHTRMLSEMQFSHSSIWCQRLQLPMNLCSNHPFLAHSTQILVETIQQYFCLCFIKKTQVVFSPPTRILFCLVC
jgi:hypothetical protein